MSHFGDYMDGVPVKISEKYKRPPLIDLPYNLNGCPLRAQNVVENAQYCATFEKNVLSKLKEFRSAKEKRKNERRHRLQLLEEAKQKKLDAIAAAEDEERLKQLSVSEVSYPSTDEISALSPDEKADKSCDITINQDSSPVNAEVNITNVNYPSTSTAAESQLNILQPIQVNSNYQQNNLLDDPDPLQELKMSTRINKIQYNHNIDTLTFRDFENDTSSPFDNVELKTINDMDVLAQVLQSQRESSVSCQPHIAQVSDHTYVIPNDTSHGQIEGMMYIPNPYTEQPLQTPNSMYSSPQHYPNEYYTASENENVNMYMPNYQYYVPANMYPGADPTYYGNQIQTIPSEVNHIPNGSTYIPQPYYYQYPQVPVSYPNVPYSTVAQSENVENKTTEISQTIVKSRSQSVPDIVKELNEELALLKVRANERSYNASPALKSVPQTSKSCDKKVENKERRSRKNSEKLPNPFEKLSPKLQEMCKRIHGMGFPLDRVARVCTLVGDNDKKIIEGLLLLGELMDLGFSEGRVSAALAKHEFNRDKALDELVS